MIDKQLQIHHNTTHKELYIPYADRGIRAGFPSPAQDYMEMAIDLNKELVKHPASTFYGRVVGDSMKDAGIFEGDILVIDKSLEPQTGDMAVCFIDGEFTIKYIEIRRNTVWLIPGNEAYAPLKVTSQNEFMIWGIVTYSIHNQQNKRAPALHSRKQSTRTEFQTCTD